VLLNYACPRALLEPLVPAGTRIDPWQGETLVSLVGFLFADTRVLGIPVPFHRTFEEVNLRYYVRREVADGTPRRAVVFVRELVPRAAVAAVARWAYEEPYLSVPMSHAIDVDADRGGTVQYRWRFEGLRFDLSASVTGPAVETPRGSDAEFITEHYWGCTRQRDGSTIEYEVEHPRWRTWSATDSAFEGPAERLYGPAFGRVLAQPPRSAFVALGSPVTVYRPARLSGGRPS
jgi:uncharacterized protein YqjF (DUF2071 family)